MNKFLSIAPALKLISEGRLFIRVFVIITRVLAGLFVLGGVINWLHAWRVIFQLGIFGILGGVFFQIVFLAGVCAIAQILWIRAGDIAAQPSSDFTVIPIVSIFLRMLGEIWACSYIVLGVGGCFLILFAGFSNLTYGLIRELPSGGLVWSFLLYPLLETDSTFPAAILLLVSCVVAAFFALVTFYLLAEFVGVLVGIARDIRAMRRYYEPSIQQNAGEQSPGV